jgi:hypothetical protein
VHRLPLVQEDLYFHVGRAFSPIILSFAHHSEEARREAELVGPGSMGARGRGTGISDRSGRWRKEMHM